MFSAKTLEELKAAAEIAGIALPLSERLEALRTPLNIGAQTVPNRIVIQPMEGCDGNPDGSPSQLTRRRYDRFARSGAGLIWYEACAARREGRANPRQAWLTRENLDSYRELTDFIRETALHDGNRPPLLILQATHSGRYSKAVRCAETRHCLQQSPF